MNSETKNKKNYLSFDPKKTALKLGLFFIALSIVLASGTPVANAADHTVYIQKTGGVENSGVVMHPGSDSPNFSSGSTPTYSYHLKACVDGSPTTTTCADPTPYTFKWTCQTVVQSNKGCTTPDNTPISSITGPEINVTTLTDAILAKVDVYQGSTLVASATTQDPTAKDENGKTGSLTLAGATPVWEEMPFLKGILALINTILQGIVLILNYFIYYIFAFIITPMIVGILRIQVHSLEFSAVILAGWVFLRNLMNIMFILIMLVIALGTLFRIQKLSYKELLVKVVFMAVLVNFSLVIARAILGIADTVQAQFLPANSDSIQSLAYQLMVAPQLISASGSAGTLVAGDLSITVNTVVNLFLAVAAFFAFIAIAAFLVIRIVAIWLLLLTSPIAYAGAILPWTQKFASRWWGEFVRYAFFTPILALMLHLCAIVAVSEASFIQAIAGGQFPANQQASGVLFTSLSNILIVACLIFAMYVAENSGVYGAKAVTGWAKNMTDSLTLKPAKYGANTLYESAKKKKYDATSDWSRSRSPIKRGLFNVVNPGMAWKGRQKRIAAEREESKEHAEAAAEQLSWSRKSHGLLDMGQDKASHKETIMKYAKAFDGKDIEQISGTMEEMFNDPEHLDKRASLMWHAAESGRLPDVLKGFRDKMNEKGADGELTEQAKRYREMFGIKGKAKLGSKDNRQMLNNFLAVDRDFGNRVFVGETLNDWAKKNGRTDLIYGVVPDPNHPGEYINPDDYSEEQVDEMLSHAKEWEDKDRKGELKGKEKEQFNLLNALRPRVKRGTKLGKWYEPAIAKYEAEKAEWEKAHPGEEWAGGDFRASSRLGLERIDFLDGVSGENRAKVRIRDDFFEIKDGELSNDGLAYREIYSKLETPAILKMSQKSMKDAVLEAQVDTESSALVITPEKWEQLKAVYGGEVDPSNEYAVTLRPGMENMAAAIRHLTTGHSGNDSRGATGDGMLFMIEGKDGVKRYATIGGKNGEIHTSSGGDAIVDVEGKACRAGDKVIHPVNAVEVGSKVHVPVTNTEMKDYGAKGGRGRGGADEVIGHGTGTNSDGSPRGTIYGTDGAVISSQPGRRGSNPEAAVDTDADEET